MQIKNIILATAVSTFAWAAIVNAGSCGGDHSEASTGARAAGNLIEHAVHETKAMDIVETAVSAGSFNTLVAAVQAAGLVETLQGDGPFTVFAPTDEAFAKLPAGTVENLLKPENISQLQAILTYHVISGKVTSEDVVKIKSARTVQGQSLRVSTSNGKVMIDEAEVTAVDILASNGVIHVIDSVVLPQVN